MKARKPQYARDFSELSDDDLRDLANAMVKIGLAATEKARRAALSEGRDNG